MRSLPLAVLLVAVACKGSDPTVPEPTTEDPLVGTYALSSVRTDGYYGYFSPFGIYSQYLALNDDNTFYVLDATPLGFRSSGTGNFYAPSDEQIFIGNDLYNVTADGEALVLTGSGSELTLTPSDAVPALDEWTKPVTVLEQVEVRGSDGSDLTFDGTYLWWADIRGDYDELVQYDWDTQTVVGTLEATRTTVGLEWDGANLWSSSNGAEQIYRLDAAGVSDVTSTAMGAWIYSIAWDGSNLWAYSGNEDTLYRYDPVGDTVISQVDLGELQNRLEGATVVDGDLYFTNFDRIHRCRRAPFEVLETWTVDPAEVPYMSGLTHDGTDFFAFSYDYQTETGYLTRLALD